jgi:hypothetical protein
MRSIALHEYGALEGAIRTADGIHHIEFDDEHWHMNFAPNPATITVNKNEETYETTDPSPMEIIITDGKIRLRFGGRALEWTRGKPKGEL